MEMERLRERSIQQVYDSGVGFMKKAKHALKNEEEKYYKLLVVLRGYYQKRVDIDIEDCISNVKRILAGHEELLLELKSFLPEQDSDASSPQDSACENINPSYRRCPEYAVASGRTKADASVLNDHWMSGLPREESSSKKRPPALTSEEERYELDMLIGWFKETITQVGELWNSFQDAPSNVFNGFLDIKKFFTASNLMCIEKLYGENGLDAIDLMEKNPGTALPIFLVRLNQKHNELIRFKADFNEKNKINVRSTSRGAK